MPSQKVKEKIVSQEEDIKKWFLVDARGKVLGRLATKVAAILRGKNNVDIQKVVV